ncbi:MAG: hypothetical protein JSS75_11545 [Bacteroidetes bacterium]|nr:hypothetical protein [Bacteroidota bacterium]
MKFTRTLAALVLSLAFVVPSFAQSSTPITLEMHMPKGAAYTILTDMTQKINGTSSGIDVKIDQHMVFGMSMKVKEAKKDGNQVLTTKYDRLAITQNVDAGGQQIETIVDTKDPSKNKGDAAEEIAPRLTKLIGVSYNSEYDKYGAQVSTDLDSVIAKYQVSDFAGNSENNQYAVVFPDHPVSIGDSWHAKTVKNEGGQDLTTDVTYTLKSVGTTTAEIGFESHIVGLIAEGSLDATMNGSYTVSLKTGWTSNATMQMEMNMKVKEQGTGTESPMKITSNFTITSEPKK